MEEIPYISEGCRIYILECEKEMDKLRESYLKYQALGRRLKIARARMDGRMPQQTFGGDLGKS